MGDPKRIRKKYDTPGHPWIKSRIEDEKRISKEFGTKNKKEIWKMETTLKNFKNQAKKLISLDSAQAKIETEHLFRRISELGLAQGNISFDTVLGLTIDDIMTRRLQSVIVEKNLARTVKQARQLIVHEHITVDGKVITSPAYLVSVKEEAVLSYAHTSSLFKEDHPERPGNSNAPAPKPAAVEDEPQEAPATESASSEETTTEEPAEAATEETTTEEAKAE